MRVIIISGPNGAGKTTFAGEFLLGEAGCMEFVNADNIAAGISPFQPNTVAWEAGRLMLQRLDSLARRKVDFAFETTLASRVWLNRIRQWQAAGAHVELHFLKLPNATWAVRRVTERVRMGGHAIPEPTIRRRYARGWENFKSQYQSVVDRWCLYDSSVMPPELLQSGPESDEWEEDPGDYGSKLEKADLFASKPYRGTDGLPALIRAAEKAIARARAAGLEPVVRFKDTEGRLPRETPEGVTPNLSQPDHLLSLPPRDPTPQPERGT